MAIKLAVFDMAGTTIADEHAVANAFRKAFSNYGLDISEDDVKPLMGYKKTKAIELVLDHNGSDWDDVLMQDIHDDFVDEMVDHYTSSKDVKALPTAENTFLALKERGIRVALNTGFPREIADVLMERMQWKERGLIDDYIASDEVESGRPAAFMIQKLMERSGITDPKEVVKIGDTEVDVNEGRNAGCAIVIAVTTGAFTREQLQPYNPDYILSDLSEVPAIIFARG
jgi:phosphonatase-like hydrolase